MEDKDFNKILEVFAKGTELNLGIHPDTNVVKYGYYYINKDLTLYLQASGKEINIIKNYIETNKAVHFNKWSGDGKFVSGDGNVTILEKKEEKTDGLNIIMRQQTGNDTQDNFDENELNDTLIFKLLVQNINILKY